MVPPMRYDISKKTDMPFVDTIPIYRYRRYDIFLYIDPALVQAFRYLHGPCPVELSARAHPGGQQRIWTASEVRIDIPT
jgi:hypothetical protein